MLSPLLKSALVQVDENLGGFQCTTTDHHMLYHHRGWHRSYQVNNPLDVAPARSQKTWHCVGQSRGELPAGVRPHTARRRRGRRAEVGLVYYRIVWWYDLTKWQGKWPVPTCVSILILRSSNSPCYLLLAVTQCLSPTHSWTVVKNKSTGTSSLNVFFTTALLVTLIKILPASPFSISLQACPRNFHKQA